MGAVTVLFSLLFPHISSAFCISRYLRPRTTCRIFWYVCQPKKCHRVLSAPWLLTLPLLRRRLEMGEVNGKEIGKEGLPFSLASLPHAPVHVASRAKWETEPSKPFGPLKLCHLACKTCTPRQLEMLVHCSSLLFYAAAAVFVNSCSCFFHSRLSCATCGPPCLFLCAF